MRIKENIASAWTSLKSNKMRTFLTMLGIIIGIASVIGIMTVGNGLSSTVTSNMSSLGANNVTISVQQRNRRNNNGGSAATSMSSMMSGTTINAQSLISESMIDDVKEKYKNQIDGIGLSENAGSYVLTNKGKNANIMLAGVSEDFLDIESVSVKTGRGLNANDVKNSSYNAVVSSKLVDNLYQGNYKKAVGKKISVVKSGTTYTFDIVGVYKYEASSMMSAGSSTSDEDISTSIYIPVKVAKTINASNPGYLNFTIKNKSSINSDKFVKKVIKYMNDKYYSNNEQFHLTGFSMESMLSTMTTMVNSVSLGLAIIAGISLLVGGIGVMNIMLVSVTERTREIGIRKALGATNKDIRHQFVIESIIVCLIGGAIGIVLGSIVGHFGSSAIGFEAYPSVSSILIAFGFSFAIGVFFGFYPANKAAKLDPIDALRYE